MAWIMLQQSVFTHRKTLEAAEALGIPELYVAAHLAALWTWAIDNAPDGLLPVSRRTIAKAAQWPNDPDELVNALVAVGYLDTDDDARLTIHNWEEYGGKLATRRQKEADRLRNLRSQKGGNHEGNPPENTARSTNAGRTASGHAVRTHLEQSRVEQIREEKSSVAAARGGGAPAEADTLGLPPGQYAALRLSFSHDTIAAAKQAHDSRPNAQARTRWDSYLRPICEDLTRQTVTPEPSAAKPEYARAPKEPPRGAKPPPRVRAESGTP